MTGPKRQPIAQLDAAIKRNRAMAMIREGKRHADVVEAGIYSSRGAVTQAINEALKIARREMVGEAEQYKALQLDRLNTLLSFTWPLAKKGSLPHIEQCRKLINDISDLTGAKAPVQVEIGESDVDRLIGRLRRSIAARTAGDPGEVVDGEILDPGAGEDRQGGVPPALPDAGSPGSGSAAEDPPDPRA